MKFSDDEKNIKKALEDAGAIEVYQVTDNRNLGNFHSDHVGDYVGDALEDIPEKSLVEWEIFDAEKYDQTILANCGGNPADFVCEDTGLVVCVQFCLEQE